MHNGQLALLVGIRIGTMKCSVKTAACIHQDHFRRTSSKINGQLIYHEHLTTSVFYSDWRTRGDCINEISSCEDRMHRNITAP